MRSIMLAATLALGTIVAAPVYASENCAAGPRERWLPQDQIKAKAEEMGYTVRSVKQEDGCFEVKAIDKAGAKVEIYVDPISGAVVRQKED